MYSALGGNSQSGLMGLELPKPTPVAQAPGVAPTAPAPAATPVAPGAAPKHFNGAIDVDGKKVEVKNSEMAIEGSKVFVSSDGGIVTGKDGALIGVVQNGKLLHPTPDIIKLLSDKGIVTPTSSGPATVK